MNKSLNISDPKLLNIISSICYLIALSRFKVCIWTIDFSANKFWKTIEGFECKIVSQLTVKQKNYSKSIFFTFQKDRTPI